MSDGPFAWLMVIVALLLIFGGGKKLPEIGRGLGEFIKEFKRAQREDDPAKAAEAKPAEPKPADPSKAETK